MPITTKTKQKYTDMLGMIPATAASLLRKRVMFDLAVRLGISCCYRCGHDIETPEDLSIDHKVAWRRAESPKDAFFDMSNVAFSHHKCNSATGFRRRR